MSLTKDLTVFVENCQLRNSITELSNKIVVAFFRVHNELGPGLLESCYHNALYIEMKATGLNIVNNAQLNVHYRGEVVGEFFSDLVVNNSIIIEIKSVQALSSAHEAQLINYLRISKLKVGYLVNFQGSRVIFKRFVV